MTDTPRNVEIRPMEPGDTDEVRRIARESLTASYGDILGPETVESAVPEWYGTEAFEDYLESDEMVFVVAVADGEVVGFSQSHVIEEVGKGRILWLHVDPDDRGSGVATALFEHTCEALNDRSIERITGLVIAENEEGNRFYEDRGFEKLYERTVEIAGETHTENVYGGPGIEVGELEPTVTADGTEVYIDADESSRGTGGLFYAAYRDAERSARYGWFCTNCESVDNAMDSMGRIECNVCGNRRKATRWDAGYL